MAIEEVVRPVRRRLPDQRRSITHKFTVYSKSVNHICANCGTEVTLEEGGIDLYLTVGFFDDGSPGELFVKLARHGNTLKGLCDQWLQAVSVGLQYGIPLQVFCRKGLFVAFEPSGPTDDFIYDEKGKVVGKLNAASLVDCICKWLMQEVVKQPFV